VDLDEMLYGCVAIDRDSDAVIVLSHSFKHFKMVDSQISEVDGIPAPVSLAQQ
jgi:hypothetical protein